MTQRQSARASKTSGRTSGRATAGGKPSARGGVGGDPKDKKAKAPKRSRGGGTELAIGLGVLTLLIVVCVVLYVQRNQEKRDFDAETKATNRAKEENIDNAMAAFRQAEAVGMAFVTSKNEKATEDELFAPFRSSSNVYNVVYNRQYKDKKRAVQTDQHALHKERLTSVGIGGTLAMKEGVAINLGKAEGNSIDIVIARKSYSPDKDDKSNNGGEILVIINAVK